MGQQFPAPKQSHTVLKPLIHTKLISRYGLHRIRHLQDHPCHHPAARPRLHSRHHPRPLHHPQVLSHRDASQPVEERWRPVLRFDRQEGSAVASWDEQKTRRHQRCEGDCPVIVESAVRVRPPSLFSTSTISRTISVHLLIFPYPTSNEMK